MSLARRTSIAILAVACLTAAALAFVWIVTEPGGARPAAPSPAADAAAQAAAPVPQPAPPPEAGIAAPAEWRAEHPSVPVPVPNATPTVAAPPPTGVPSDPAEREDAILEVRRNRFADQVERLNRRTVDRGGKPGDAGARPPSTAPGPGASRRSSLSGAD